MPGPYKCNYKWSDDKGCKKHICGIAFGMPVPMDNHEHSCRNCREKTDR